MANTLQLKNDIKKLKTALASKGLSASIKNKLKGKLEKAQTDLKSTAPRKVSGAKSTIASLKELVKKKKYSIYKKSGVDLKKDSEEPALPIGRRVSKGIKGNQYGNKKSSKGNVYYEYRANRLDVKQPSKTAKYPKLADGGEVAKYLTQNEYKKVVENIDKNYGIKGETIHKEDLWIAYTQIPEKELETPFYSDRQMETALINTFEKNGWAVEHKDYYDEEDGEDDYKKGGKLSKKDFFKKYEENEDENMHSENVVLLAENYGTESDIRDAKTILAKHESIGHLPTNLRQERDALHDKLYAKYVQSREDGGMMAEGGKLKFTTMTEESFLDKYADTNVYPESVQNTFDIIRYGSNDKNKLDGFLSAMKLNGYKVKEKGEFALAVKKRNIKEDGGVMAEGGVTEKEVVDSNAQMVLSKIKEVHHHADELGNIVTKKSDIEAWVVAKIERASTDLSDITHYLDGQHDKMSMGGGVYNHLHKMDKK